MVSANAFFALQDLETIRPDDAQAIVGMLDYLFAVIGIVDNFDESMEMFEHVFGLPFVEASPALAPHPARGLLRHPLLFFFSGRGVVF